MATTEEIARDLMAHYEPGVKEISPRTLVYRAECHACDFVSAYSFDREWAETEGREHAAVNDLETPTADDVVHVTSVHWAHR